LDTLYRLSYLRIVSGDKNAFLVPVYKKDVVGNVYFRSRTFHKPNPNSNPNRAW